MVENTGRTNIASIVFLDIVAYSKETDARQMTMKSSLNDTIGEAVAEIAEAERIILDTGDGVAICFLGDPEDALFVATAVMDAVRKKDDQARQVLRVGINLGPVKVVTDLNGRPNVVGDGINVAQRIVSFAADDEILVSRSYYEVVARLKEGNETLFRYMGAKKDKHIREHQVYALSADTSLARLSGRGQRASDETEAETVAPPPVGGGPMEALPQDMRDEVERRLADRIGPLAQVIVRRAASKAGSLNEFYATIASVIPDDADREAFLAEAPMPDAIQPGEADQEPPPETRPITALSESDLALAEQRLAEHIGPLARVLVKKAARQAVDLRDLYERLADHVDNDANKSQFLAEGMAED